MGKNKESGLIHSAAQTCSRTIHRIKLHALWAHHDHRQNWCHAAGSLCILHRKQPVYTERSLLKMFEAGVKMIVVAAGGENRRLRELLRSAGALSMLCTDAAQASFCGDGPDLIFLSARVPLRISCENAALVVRRGAGLPSGIECENQIAIVDSADAAVREHLARRRLPAITCGLSGADTLTLSSLTADSAMIALQRQITAFDGTKTDPFELPVLYSQRIETFDLLAAAAVFCLMGRRSPLSGSSVWRISACSG